MTTSERAAFQIRLKKNKEADLAIQKEYDAAELVRNEKYKKALQRERDEKNSRDPRVNVEREFNIGDF